MRSIYNSNSSLEGFCEDTKRYEHVKFLLPDFTRFYNEIKAYHSITTFSKELKLRVEDISDQQVQAGAYANNMTLFQIIPQELHGTLFFKVIQTLCKKMGSVSDMTHINEKIKVALFMMLRIEGNEAKTCLGSRLNKQLLKCYEKI